MAEEPKPDGCAKLKPDEEEVDVLLPNTEPWPNPELWPNVGVAVLWPKRPVLPVLLAVLALLVPKENELALLAVEAPKRPALVLVLLGPAPNDVWPKEKPAGVSELLTG